MVKQQSRMAGELMESKEAEASAGNGKLAASLPAHKQTALEMLLTGKTMAETAREAGVARCTLYEWVKHDPVFGALYNQWRNQLQDSCRSRLLGLTDKATDAIEKALEAGDARTALQLLKGMGMIGNVPMGPTDPAEVRMAGELEETRRKTALRSRLMNAEADEMLLG